MEINWLKKPKTYKQRIADRLNECYSDIQRIDAKNRRIDHASDENAARMISLDKGFSILTDRLEDDKAFEIATKLELKAIKETLKTISIILDDMTKKK